jgi:hypothetical protein
MAQPRYRVSGGVCLANPVIGRAEVLITELADPLRSDGRGAPVEFFLA